MQRVKAKKGVKKLTHFIDKQGLVPIFILMCFPFTPNTVVNFVASFSHIKMKNYFIILLFTLIFFLNKIIPHLLLNKTFWLYTLRIFIILSK